jgi:hypothetical protein
MSLVSETTIENTFEFLEFDHTVDADTIGDVLKEFGVCVVRNLVPATFVEFLLATSDYTLRGMEARARFFKYDGSGGPNPHYQPVFWARMQELEDYCGRLGFEMERICHTALHDSGIAAILFRYFNTTRIDIVKQLFIARRQVPGVLSNELPFHQDVTNYTNADFVNVWVPLTSCGKRSATMDLIPVAIREQLAVTSRTDSHHPTVEVDAEEVFKRFGTQSIYRPVMEPGDVLFFNEHTIHRTHMPRDADLERRSVEIRVCDHFNPTPY